MGADDVEEALPKIFEFNPEVMVIISPNTALPGPCKSTRRRSNAEKSLESSSLILLANAVKGDIEKQGLGYIIITGDPLIGARKEFLDPIEMALFNSNINKFSQ